MSRDRCKRCGECCHYYMYGVKHPCRYLVNLSDGTTECAVYENRL